MLLAQRYSLDASPSYVHLFSAFMALESPNFLITLARKCGEGFITEEVQCFIRDHCLSRTDICRYYMKNLLKKFINEIELNHFTVLDEFYEACAWYMTSVEGNSTWRQNSKTLKHISFIFPDHQEFCLPNVKKLVVPLQCSVNMLEGDTGCYIWPSSLFLSEFILSYPGLFSKKSCLEVGSGLGLVGVCLAHAGAAEVTLSDGDQTTLLNMKTNLEINHVDLDRIRCVLLQWESVTNHHLQNYMPDIILGADVIYDPACLPHLLRILSILLTQKRVHQHLPLDIQYESIDDNTSCIKFTEYTSNVTDKDEKMQNSEMSPGISEEVPVAYIASVIRRNETFDSFMTLAEEAGLCVVDLTHEIKLFDLLPYMQSYDRTTIHFIRISI